MVIQPEYLIAVKATAATASMWIAPIQQSCDRWEIDSPKRVAAFLAQIAHESASFARTIENLNYSSKGLRDNFKKYFPTDELAEEYARKPEAIANRVYANRMGNGDEASGDGWKYRGRGLIQLTGKNNVRRFSVDYFGDDRLVADPAQLQGPELASMSAGHYWHKNGLNALADRDEFQMISHRINGGAHGMEDRLERWNALRSRLQV